MDNVPLTEITRTCILMRTRLLSRVVSGLYQAALSPFDIGAAQFVLLVVIHDMGQPSRADIGRIQHQDRSTLTRNLQGLLSAGWVQETASPSNSRVKYLTLTRTGKAILRKAGPAWSAAQAEANQILGLESATAITATANRLMTEGLP